MASAIRGPRDELVNEVCEKHHHLCHFDSHHRLATPVAAWEQLKIGGGTPPILTPQGWLFLDHCVCEASKNPDSAGRLIYSAGLLVLDEKHPHLIIVPNVVFPTAIDRRDDLGLRGRFDVYYGMADNRIGVARLDLPEHLPTEVKSLEAPAVSDFIPCRASPGGLQFPSLFRSFRVYYVVSNFNTGIH